MMIFPAVRPSASPARPAWPSINDKRRGVVSHCRGLQQAAECPGEPPAFAVLSTAPSTQPLCRRDTETAGVLATKPSHPAVTTDTGSRDVFTHSQGNPGLYKASSGLTQPWKSAECCMAAAITTEGASGTGVVHRPCDSSLHRGECHPQAKQRSQTKFC